ncbi:MAG: 50S ribosomal protein L28 [Maricaulaceae bacterium]|jgi:large subunit ribosomal protein L28
MARRCEFTGVSPMTGNNVSHSNRKTKRRFAPNLHDVTLLSDALGRSFKFKITASALRSVDHVGGLDAYLVKASDEKLSKDALKVKKDVKKKLAETEAAPSA